MTQKAKRLHPGYASLLFPDTNLKVCFPARILLIHADTFTHSTILVNEKKNGKQKGGVAPVCLIQYKLQKHHRLLCS